MRRRLTYANVMATLALFFALTGGAWAATSKYLMASDPITQGDLADSTYGNPVIGPGKVTTGKIADGAVTAAKLASPTDAFSTGEPPGIFVLTANVFTNVQTLDLPAGKYALTAKVVVGRADTGGDELAMTCRLLVAGALLSRSSASVPLDGVETIALQATFASATADAIAVECFTGSTPDFVQEASIDAIRVDTTNGS